MSGSSQVTRGEVHVKMLHIYFAFAKKYVLYYTRQ